MPQAAIPVEKFGKDHWYTFAYAETCCVDGKDGIGRLALARMRCNAEKRSMMAANMRWAPRYGTRLMGFFDFADRDDPAKAEAAGLQLLAHDDWDCLDDLEAAGFIEVLTITNGMVRMTELGFKVSAALRQHKAEGKHFATFVWAGVPKAAAQEAAHA